MEYPVIVEKDGIKIKPESMIVDKMYYCIYDNKVYIFYKDEENLTHCYEVDDVKVVQEIVDNPDDLEDILLKHSKEWYQNNENDMNLVTQKENAKIPAWKVPVGFGVVTKQSHQHFSQIVLGSNHTIETKI